eukprot:COSAG02_NODE_12491_length_1537_cov_2.157858_1_plen_89_part_00
MRVHVRATPVGSEQEEEAREFTLVLTRFASGRAIGIGQTWVVRLRKVPPRFRSALVVINDSTKLKIDVGDFIRTRTALWTTCLACVKS